MTKAERKQVKNDYIIYKCSNWSNAHGSWCKITYAFKFSKFAVSHEETITTEWLGCRWASLYAYLYK